MKKVKIKTEYPPNRCEICHKMDCFDVDTLFCSRCKNVEAYKEESFQLNKPENQGKENYLEILPNKNYGWKRRSNEVSKRFAIAGGLVFLNFVCFVGILKLSVFSGIMEVGANVIGGLFFLFLMLLVEYLLLKIFSSYNKLFCHSALIGVYLTLAVIVGIFLLFVTFYTLIMF